jgi:hypothetical protein
MTRVKATVLPLEKSKITETEKGKTGGIKGFTEKEFILAVQTVNSRYY